MPTALDRMGIIGICFVVVAAAAIAVTTTASAVCSAVTIAVATIK
jgi:hypothetical protein